MEQEQQCRRLDGLESCVNGANGANGATGVRMRIESIDASRMGGINLMQLKCSINL